jgi:outer membrane receptor protein involved in Fe transport
MRRLVCNGPERHQFFVRRACIPGLPALAALSIALCPALFPAGAAAEDEEYGASASVTRESFEHSRSVEVVTRKEAQESAAGEVGDILERAPGVVVQRTASGSAVPILRGLTGYQVLLLLDDLRLNDALTRAGGGAVLNLIDPEAVAQIDVVRGPASVLYGSDALGGVVHVRTESALAGPNRADGVHASAALRGASAEHSGRGQGSFRASFRNLGLRLSGGGGYSGQVHRGDGLGDQPYTGFQDWAVTGKLEAKPARAHQVGLVYHSGHIFDMPRSDVSQPEDVQITEQLVRDSVVANYTGRFAGKLRLHTFLGLTRRREIRGRYRPTRDQLERERVRNLQAGVRASGSPWRGGSLEGGYEASIDRIASSASTEVDGVTMQADRGRYVDGSKYDMHALYLLLTQRLAERWSLLFGTRGTLVIARAPADPLFVDLLGDDAALDRQFIRPVASLGMRAQWTPEFALVASVLGGFRAPNLEDFQAFGGGARGFTLPNLMLDPERSWTFELGAEYVDKLWDLRAYAFTSLLSGLIVRVPTSFQGMTEIDGEPVIGRQNAGQSLLTGGELSLTRLFEFGLFAQLSTAITWGKTERPLETGGDITEPASKVPPPLFLFRVGYDHADVPYFGNLTLTAQTKQTRLSEGDTLDVRLCPDGPEGCTEVPGFAELTLRGGVRLREGVLLSLAVENLINSAYRTYASGAYAPGRNFIATLRVTL